MEARLEAIETDADLNALMREIGARAKAAARVIALADPASQCRGSGDASQRDRNSRLC
jgi:hypothetical protein